MKISEVMTRDVEVLSPSDTLVEAASKMDDLNVGVVPVCDGDRIRGILTDRDIIVRAIAAGFDPNERTVSEIMTEPVIYCYEDDDIQNAGRLMEDNQIRRLVVVDRNDKKLVGIVSLGDLAVDTQDEGFAGEVLERISEPSEPAA